ncbi:WXG100 family type VII secretion target [Streptomyces sp. NPDC048196]|uniref:WXG100 family type VII secretion target n=1 Tax=Streptomyces sp. NPDC048196 TaxID=3154712 RepID=UPI00340D07C2
MGAADKAKEIVQDLTGMWWPEGDEDELREAARAWRTFADDVEDCTAACHKKAQDVIDNNKGKSIDAFGGFWRRYHGGGKGYLDDVATAARDMAKALDKYADQVAEAKKKIEHELEIAGAVLVAGTALAVFTGGISEVAAAGATEAIVAAASTAGVAVSATVAEIAGTVLATAAIGGIEAITVDVVVAQGGRNLLGDQKGINLAEVKDAGVSGVLLGGALGGAGRTAKAVGEAGGFKNVFGKMKLDGLGTFKNPLRDFEISLPNLGGPRFAMAGEGPVGPVGPTWRPLMRNAEGSGGASGAPRVSGWEASSNLKGPAAGKTLKRPNERHTIGGAGRAGKNIKEENTIILPGYSQEVEKDIAGIAEGKAAWLPDGERYEINGRTYGVHENGTVYPAKGPGFVEMDRNEYAALSQIVKAKGDLSAAPQLTKNPRFVNNPEVVEKALAIYNGTYTP